VLSGGAWGAVLGLTLDRAFRGGDVADGAVGLLAGEALGAGAATAGVGTSGTTAGDETRGATVPAGAGEGVEPIGGWVSGDEGTGPARPPGLHPRRLDCLGDRCARDGRRL
jgi:hypothetical protein